MEPFPYRRICVVGTTGSGKSTMAETISRRLHIPHIELDALHWKPGWKEADRESTRLRLGEFVQSEAWVVDGNYRFLRDLLWTRAQALVWLDHPLPLILRRLWRRTWKRVLTKEVLWGTNRERLVDQFFSKDSLFLYSIKTYRRHKREYAEMPKLPEYSHLQVFHIQTQREAEAFLDCLPIERGLSTIDD